MFALRLGRLRPAAALRGATPLPLSLRSLHATPVAWKVVKKSSNRSTLTPTQRRALEKQQKLAKALKGDGEDEYTAADVSQWQKVPAGTVLTLDDLKPFEPLAKRRPSPKSPAYAQMYEELVDRVHFAFTRDQIVKICRLLDLNVRQGDRKRTLVEQVILTAWGWPKPEPKEGVTARDIPLTKAQLFVLQRSKEVEAYISKLDNVRFGLAADETGTMFTMHAHGAKSSVVELDAFIASHTRDVVSVEWPVSAMNGLQPSEKGLWAISTATDALVESVGWTSLRATGANDEVVARARDMVLRAAQRAKAETFRPTLGALLPHDADRETRFALVPHMPASVSPLPWSTELAVAERPLFRLQMVESKREMVGVRELRHRSVEIADAKVMALSTRTESASLRDVVSQTLDKAALPGSSSSDRSLTFIFGHHLAEGSCGKAFTPPIDGAWSLEETASPLLKLSTPIFGPVLPASMLLFPLPGPAQRFRRVTYAADGMRYVATYAFPKEAEADLVADDREDRPWIVALDKQLAMARKEADARKAAAEYGSTETQFEFDAIKSLLLDEEPAPAPPREMQVTATLGKQARRDVIFPDRPVDARIIADTSHPSALPEALRQFFEKVHADADAASKIALTDLVGLRRGTALPEPKEVKKDGWDDEVYEGYDDAREWGLEEDELDNMPEEGMAENADKAEAEVEEAHSRPDIIAPNRITISDIAFTLESDEVLEVIESTVALDSFKSEAVKKAESESEEAETEAEVEAAEEKADEAEREQKARAVLRAVALADLTGPGGVVRYGELSTTLNPAIDSTTSPIDQAIWRELANVTRECPHGIRTMSSGIL